MISKKHPIEILEQALRYDEQELEACQGNIKSFRKRASEKEDDARIIIARISGLKDAIHKLKGLDNLEKKNKIPDPAGGPLLQMEHHITAAVESFEPSALQHAPRGRK